MTYDLTTAFVCNARGKFQICPSVKKTRFRFRKNNMITKAGSNNFAAKRKYKYEVVLSLEKLCCVIIIYVAIFQHSSKAVGSFCLFALGKSGCETTCKRMFKRKRPFPRKYPYCTSGR